MKTNLEQSVEQKARQIKKSDRAIRQTELLELIIDSITDKKGQQIVAMDMRELPETFCDYLVVCEGNSVTQVSAIGDHIGFNVKEETGEYPFNVEGKRNSEWVVIDFVDVVVHVFVREKRDFYQLEDLWSDAVRINYDEFGKAIK